MICVNCHNEIPDDAAFCPRCGSATGFVPHEEAGRTSSQAPPTQDPAPTYKEFFSDRLYTLICILTCAGAFFTLLDKGILNLALVFPTLFSVFMWLFHFGMKNGKPNRNYIRYISGTVFAKTLVCYISGGILVIMGFLSMFVSGFLASVLRKILDGTQFYRFFDGSNLFGAAGISAGLLLIIAGVASALIGYFGYRAVHGFAASLYDGGRTVKGTRAKISVVKTWLIVFGVIFGLGVLVNLRNGAALLHSASIAGAYFTAYFLIGKYFR